MYKNKSWHGFLEYLSRRDFTLSENDRQFAKSMLSSEKNKELFMERWSGISWVKTVLHEYMQRR